MDFTSKKDTWLTFLIWGTTILMIWLMIVELNIWMFLIGAVTIALFLSFWFGTRYKIEAQLLHVQSGPFRSTVRIEDIKRLKATKTLLSGPALSLDRIEILHKQYDIVIVSPKDKTAFVQALITKNKRIEVDPRLLNESQKAAHFYDE